MTQLLAARAARRPLLVTTALLLLLAVTGTAAGTTAGSDDRWTRTTGGYVSGNVEYLRTVPLETSFVGSSATLHDGHLYVTTFRSFSIFDVQDAENPTLLATEHLGAQAINEQPETNGSILLLSNDVDRELQVWDVEDKTDPVQIATVPLPRREHIWTCVLECAYAYGAAGAIVDLRIPARPKAVGDWSTLVKPTPTPRQIHTIEEVAPGRVLVGASHLHYLDATKDPAKPTVLASTPAKTTVPGPPSNPTSLPAHVEWPQEARHPFALVSMETPFAGDCDEQTGGFQTYDTKAWKKTRTFDFVDEYVVSDAPRGTYSDGLAPYHVFGCSAYGFDVAEHYAQTGQVAVAWFEDGVRLLSVNAKGHILEQGGFVPFGGSTVFPIWGNDEIVYAVDMYRGIDVLRVTSASQSRPSSPT